MSRWFQIKEVAQDVYVIEEPGHVQSYLINGRTHSALVDTGAGLCDIRKAIQTLLLERVIVLNTHWHFDHIGGNTLFDDVGISEKEKHLVEMDLPNSVLMDLYMTTTACSKCGLTATGLSKPSCQGTMPIPCNRNSSIRSTKALKRYWGVVLQSK